MNVCEKCGVETKEKGMCKDCAMTDFSHKYNFLFEIYGVISLILLVAQAVPLFGLTELFLDCRDFYDNDVFVFFRIIMLILTASGVVFLFKGISFLSEKNSEKMFKYTYTGSSFISLGLFLEGFYGVFVIIVEKIDVPDLKINMLGIIHIVLAIACLILSIYTYSIVRSFCVKYNIQCSLVDRR